MQETIIEFRNPFEGMKLFKLDNQRIRYLSDEEYGRFMAEVLKLDPMDWLRRAIILLLETGMRSGEARTLQWSDCHLEVCELHLRQAKAGKRVVRVPQRLADEMTSGIYREPALTVGALAHKLGIPEHQLRRLINKGLGYRNFSSFLNAHRIPDAQTALADPARAREQVLTIALDLGYGSIAPFNRAFKEATGTTPTAYRRDALQRDSDS